MKSLLLIIALLIISTNLYNQKRTLNVDDLWSMKRINSTCLSPDGKSIVFSVTSYNMQLNKGNTDIWLVDSDGSNIRPLKNSEKNESEPKFSPDGKTISFTRNNQVWTCNADGSNEKQLTDIYSGASGIIWSKSNDKILYTSSVYPECLDQECNRKKDEEKESSKVNARIITDLMFRYWDDWRGEKRSHLFLQNTIDNKLYNVIQNSKSDVPPVDLGSKQDYCFSPDGSEIAFTMNEDDTLAISTNNDIFTIKIDDISANKLYRKKISTSTGNDNQPMYSPDGKYIAYTSMQRAGFEADRLRIMLYSRLNETTKELTINFDLTVTEITWSPDSKYIYFIAQNQIYNSIYKLEIATEKISLILKENINSSLMVSPDGSKLYFKSQNSRLPDEIFSINTDGTNLKQLTLTNNELLSQLEMNPVETVLFEGAEKAQVQAIILKPPFFKAGNKYPMIMLIHGGPQGKWEDDFHYRWNLQLFASKGYVIVAPNPRGSTGYGQKFTDEISQDWGGKVYTDIMNCYDYAVNNLDYIDKKNTFAAGASYGGYMMNWIEGHTDQFNALVCHDGVFNLESMYGTTEELWFPGWEFGGAPWENRELYQKYSPHQYVKNFKTPMLVIHGGKDFRVSEEQAFQLFTSLQRMGVESKFLYFPEENHFVTKPQNSRLWWDTIFDWFEKHKVKEFGSAK